MSFNIICTLFSLCIVFGMLAKPTYSRALGAALKTCDEPTDIVFVLDTSTSMYPPDFHNYVKGFVKDVILSFKIGEGPKETRVGVILFSSQVYLEFHLNEYFNADDIVEAVENIQFRGGNTYTHLALDYVREKMLAPENGAREGVPKLVVVLTDGASVSKYKTKDAAHALRDTGAEVFALGVGTRLNFEELYAMASEYDLVFQVYDAQALDSIKQRFSQSTCKVLQTKAPPSTTTTTTTTTTSTTTTTTTPTTTTTTPTTTTPTTTTTTPTTTTTTPTTTTTTPTTTTTTPTTTTTTPTTTTTTIPTTTTTTPTTTTTTTTTTTPTTTTTTPTTTTTTTPPTTTSTTTKKTTAAPQTIKELPQREGVLTEQGCREKPVDIYFLLDASSSVWVVDFEDRVLPFVRDMAKEFQISPSYARVGLVTFSDKVNPEFGLSEHDSLRSLLNAVQPEKVEYLTGGTNTGDAIRYVTENGFNDNDDEEREGLVKIIVTVTDGLSQEPHNTAEAAAIARSKGILMFAVGVGKYVNNQELSDISSNPDAMFTFFVDNFKALRAVKDKLTLHMCRAVADAGEGKKLGERAVCDGKPSDVMFVYDSFDLRASATSALLTSMVGRFSQAAASIAPNTRVGVFTQRCTSGTVHLQVSDDTASIVEKKVNAFDASGELGLHGLLEKLRMEDYSEEHRQQEADLTGTVRNPMAVVVMDDRTTEVELLMAQIAGLKMVGVTVRLVVVGQLPESTLRKVFTSPLENQVIMVGGYEDLRSDGVNAIDLLCMNGWTRAKLDIPTPPASVSTQTPPPVVDNSYSTSGTSTKVLTADDGKNYDGHVDNDFDNVEKDEEEEFEDGDNEAENDDENYVQKVDTDGLSSTKGSIPSTTRSSFRIVFNPV